jgi:putative SOS response-associated peptidase YedK
MCYYNSIKVTREEYDQLKALEKTIAFLNEEFAIHKGFDYGDYPVVRPIGKTHETERVKMQWGFLPGYLKTWEDVKKFRYGYKDETGRYYKPYLTLNATSEELLNKIYKEAALKRRCLIPSFGFYEWMHVQVVGKSGKLLKTPEKFPYLVRMKSQEEFYMAGVWQPWFDTEFKMITNCFSLITTVANSLMKQIHNSKERMPTILPGDLAEAWLYQDLSEQEILDIANYQAASMDMVATPLDKDFLKKENPHERVVYKEVPELVYSQSS